MNVSQLNITIISQCFTVVYTRCWDNVSRETLSCDYHRKSSNVSRETSETKELYLNYNRISLFFIAKTAA